VSERALFVIDSNGIVRWNYISPIGVNPGVNGVLRALESLNKDTERFEAVAR
jgi:alkyl hydroperoxide reductase subunit AhpC